MPIDRLQGLLQHLSVQARMFHNGPLCGVTDFPDNGQGQLHLMRSGPVEVMHAGSRLTVTEPTVLFYPRPLAHRFVADTRAGADMTCANISFGPGAHSPIALALPGFVQLPLAELRGARPLLELLFEEAFARRCGHQVVVDRLFEAVMVLVLRHLLDTRQVGNGALAGLGHPQLSGALAALHDAPAKPWTLDTLAAHAAMSRSRFSQVFSEVVGQSPGSYMADFRMLLAQDALRRGEPLERIAEQVGYGSAASLSRAFTATCGMSPRQWRRNACSDTSSAGGHA